MPEVTPNQFPLLPCFTELKQQGFPLSPDDYKLFLEALAGGFGLENINALLFLCQKLWLKNRIDTKRFNSIAIRHINEEINFYKLKASKQKETQKSKAKLGGKKEQQPLKSPSKEEDTLLPKAEDTRPISKNIKEQGPTVTLSIEDVPQGGAGALAAKTKESRPEERFILTGSYLALRKRDAETSWRFLRQDKVRTNKQLLDINATIQHIAKTGYFESPVYRFANKNKAGVYVLIDHRGSMVAFKALTETIIKAAGNGGRILVNTAYFNNVPGETIFSDVYHSKAFKLTEFLNKASKQDSGLLVISDAGAARGRYNDNRVDATEDFYIKTQSMIKHIAWVNPLPADRWEGTSAQYIADFIPMFSADQKGLTNAIDVLRNKVNI